MGDLYDVTYDEEGYCGVGLDDFSALFPLSTGSAAAPCTDNASAEPPVSLAVRLRGLMSEMYRTASALTSSNSGLANMRRLVWGYFLGAYTAEDLDGLVSAVESNRRRYWVLVEKHRNDNLKTMQTLDPQLFHPLAPVERNPWELSQRTRESLDEIWRDVERTYQERSLFTTDPVRKTLQNVLYVWSREHDYISYKQGMNELLAVVYIVCYRDQVRAGESDAGPHFSCLCSADAKDLEADAYTLFDAVMCIETQLMFDSSAAKTPLIRNCRSSSLNLAHIVSLPGRAKGEAHNSLIARTKFICSRVLKDYDPPLFNHFQQIEIEPHLFLMRWIRLIFSREFNVNETLNLWDTVFADHFLAVAESRSLPEFQFEMIDFFAVAMMSYVRLNLLENDINYCLQRLFKFPPIEDISHLIAKAQKIRAQFHRKRDEASHGTAAGHGADHSGASAEGQACLSSTAAVHAAAEVHVCPRPVKSSTPSAADSANTFSASRASSDYGSSAFTSPPGSGTSSARALCVRRDLEAVAGRIYLMYEKAFQINSNELMEDIQGVHSEITRIIASLDS